MREMFSPTVKKIQRFSRLALVVIYVLMGLSILMGLILLGALVISPLLEQSVLHTHIDQSGLNFDFDELRQGVFTLGEKVVAVIVTLLFFATYMYGLVIAIKLLRSFEHGNIFTRQNVSNAKIFGKIALLGIIFMVVAKTSFVLISGDLKLNLPGDIPKYLVVCILWIAIWILEIGTELNTDDELTV